MIQITKDEAMAIKNKYGESVGVTITNRQKKGIRKRYYVEETRKALSFLEQCRNLQNKKIICEKRGV